MARFRQTGSAFQFGLKAEPAFCLPRFLFLVSNELTPYVLWQEAKSAKADYRK
jgi:hypothetical protein